MILELVEFNSPKGWSREQVAEEARHVIPKWQANKELLRKHYLLESDNISLVTILSEVGSDRGLKDVALHEPDIEEVIRTFYQRRNAAAVSG